MTADERSLTKTLGYEFTDKKNLTLALTHRSAGGKNNERLEYLGDAILGFIIATELYHRYPDASEGELSRLRARLVNGQTLASIARQLKLGENLRLGPGELKSGGHRRDSILAGAMEAVLGAVYLDGGIDACCQLMKRLYTARLSELSPDNIEKDPKTRLQELMQSKKLPLPEYSLIRVDGVAHNQMFTVNCSVRSLNEPTTGVGRNRRSAEQQAAELAIEALGEKSQTK